MDNKAFVIERTFNAPAEAVWKAISDKDAMKQWYFDVPEFKAVPGNEFRFTGGKDEHNQYLHICRVTEVVEGLKLSHTWRYDGYEGDSLVTWELFPEGSRTRVRLTHSGLETFPAGNPDLAKENFVQGWTDIVGTLLKDYLEKQA